MRHDVRAYLFEVVSACQAVSRFILDKSLENYRDDELLRSAVERKLEIAGDALNQTLKQFPDMVKQIPDYAIIIAFRNRLAHGYMTVDDELVWSIAVTHVPELYKVSSRILDELNASSKKD